MATGERRGASEHGTRGEGPARERGMECESVLYVGSMLVLNKMICVYVGIQMHMYHVGSEKRGEKRRRARGREQRGDVKTEQVHSSGSRKWQ